MSKAELLTPARLAMIAKCSTNNGHVRMLLGHIQALTEQRRWIELLTAARACFKECPSRQVRFNYDDWANLRATVDALADVPAPQEEGKPNE